MASSNKHWPSMFKSNTPNNHWPFNSPHLSTGNTYSPGCVEERTPEPKPRWNPRPEQIRILESIFNSGTVNPPRDEIRRIRAQLQEYGQVGDANVFYWFQNRKSRSKNKQRHCKPPHSRKPPLVSTVSSPHVAATSSSSSGEKVAVSVNSSSTLMDLLTSSVNQPFSQTGSAQFLNLTQGFGNFPDLSECVPHPHVVVSDDHHHTHDLMLMRKDEDDEKVKQQMSYSGAATVDPISLSLPSPTIHILQGPEMGQKTTVFINDVCVEIATAPFNVREAFGEDAVLIQSSGVPVLTDHWGITHQPLQHGAFYYLIRPILSPS